MVVVGVILVLAIVAMLVLGWFIYVRLREVKEAITRPQTPDQDADAMEMMEAESVTTAEAMTKVPDDVAALRARLDQTQREIADVKAVLISLRAAVEQLSMYVTQVLDSRMQRG